MKKFLHTLVLLSLVISWGLSGEISSNLRDVLENANPNAKIPVLIRLSVQANIDYLKDLTRGLPPYQRRQMVIKELKSIAQRAQSGIHDIVERAKQNQKVDRVIYLWIANAVFVKATPDVIFAIADLPEVDIIFWDPPVYALEKLDRSPIQPVTLLSDGMNPAPRQNIAWNVEKIRAPLVWQEWNITGQGVIVGHIDTGVNYNHPDLIGRIWINEGEVPNNGIDDDNNGYVDDYYGYDFAANDPDPMDDHGHGTHTAGTVAGTGASGLHTGVAPGAKIMILKTLIAGSGSEAYSIEAAQYALMMGANLCTMSLGWTWPTSSDRSTWRTTIENLAVGGVVFVKSAGNRGDQLGTYPVPHNISVPAGVPILIANAAVDSNDVRAYFSSIGPTVWDYPEHNAPPYDDYPYPPGYPKPDVSAPGVNVISLNIGGGYTPMSGTSMAAPHTAGVVALMFQANPLLTVEQLKDMLMSSTIDLGPPGFDTLFGAGRIDAYNTVQMALMFAGDPVDPRPPSDLTAYSDYTTPTSITLSWTDPDLYINGDSLGNNLAGILVFNITQSGDTTLIATVSSGVETYTHTGLTDGNLYTYTLRAYDIYDSLSPYSFPVEWYAGGSPYPAPPENLQANALNETTVVITWDDPTTQSDGTPLDDLAGIFVYVESSLVDSIPPGVEIDTIVTPAGLVHIALTAYDNESPRHESDTVEATVLTTPHVGGPDGYGYRFVDSYYGGQGAPEFQWIEISSNGMPIPMFDDDIQYITLPFPFPFYGDSLYGINVCSNGFLETSTSTDWSNEPLPDPSKQNLIAGFWDDLNPSQGGMVYALQTDSMVVIEWLDVPHYGSGGPYTFEIVLMPNGNILYQYLDINYPNNSSTIGIQGETGANDYFLQYTYNGDPIIPEDSLAVLFFYKTTLVKELPTNRRLIFSLLGPYPSPIHSKGSLRLIVPNKGKYSLILYDPAGRLINKLFERFLNPGIYNYDWTPRIPSGTYFLKFKGNEKTLVKKVIILR